MIDLELLDYDLEGAAYKDGACVDAAAVLVKVRRRQVVTAGVVTMPAGDPLQMRIPVASLDTKELASVLAAFDVHEATMLAIASAHYASETQDAKALDARIAEAAQADKAKADAQAQLDVINAKIAEANALHAEALAKVAAVVPA